MGKRQSYGELNEQHAEKIAKQLDDLQAQLRGLKTLSRQLEKLYGQAYLNDGWTLDEEFKNQELMNTVAAKTQQLKTAVTKCGDMMSRWPTI